MDEKKIEEIMTRMLGGNKGDMAKAVAGELKELVEASSRAQVDDALKQRDDATAKAEADKKTAEDARTQTEAEVEQRAELLVMCRCPYLVAQGLRHQGQEPERSHGGGLWGRSERGGQPERRLSPGQTGSHRGTAGARGHDRNERISQREERGCPLSSTPD